MTQEIIILTLPMPFGMGAVNSYLIKNPAGQILIDSGSPRARKALREQLTSAGCEEDRLRLVLLTHGDFDHIGNAAHLRACCGVPLAMHREEACMAERGDMFANRQKPSALVRVLVPFFTGFGRAERFCPDVLLEDGSDLLPYGLDARVVWLPGHSRGSIGVLTANGELFCGDLFENREAPTLNSLLDDATAAQASAARLAGLNIQRVYPGHGQPFTWEELKKG
ncbi:hypothetical protein ADN00_10000 [Ornatilinea apprima]|uniref:Metallo-beta-lactamase domain-containing protein n=1 Tax=Ornatilinea apprima TaxID=1134406 RepID=A0A0P6XU80_9CHLR|nr:MBL fold metallo-hydrolase [Ornatilinea apprima]KPL76920.1 hypothetical protein ADN00_10000 [Ornatilinea apprima]